MIYQVHMIQILFLTINDIFPYNLFPSFQKRQDICMFTDRLSIIYTVDIDCTCSGQIYNAPQLKATDMGLSRGNLRTTKSNYSPHSCNS